MLDARIANVRMLEPYSPDDLNRSVSRTPPEGFCKQVEGYELHKSHAKLNALPQALQIDRRGRMRPLVRRDLRAAMR